MKTDDLLYEMEGLLNRNLPLDAYKGKTFFITGATGLIGSLLVKSLLFLNEECSLDLTIIAVVRNIEKAKSIYLNWFEDKALHFLVSDFSDCSVSVNCKVDYIIHAASVTSSRYMITNPVETILISVNGTRSVLDLAVKNQILGMVYLSSMEVYGSPYCSRVAETDLGKIDLLSPRSSYPESKRICELLCTAYSCQYHIPVCSARLAQTFGAGILPTENRVFAQFANSVISGNDIVLHTKGESEGNYVYTFDAVVAILLLLTEGKIGESYNISNEESHISIKDMAQMVAHDIAKDRIRVIIDIPKDNCGYAPDVKMWLNSQKIRNLGWEATVGLEESYRRMLDWMNSQTYKTIKEKLL